MPITDVAMIEEHTGQARSVCIKIAKRIDEAEALLREWIGDAMYDTIRLDTSHARYTNTQKAESLLAEMIALPDLNRRVTEAGGHVRNLGLDQMGNSNTLMGHSELTAYASGLRHRARLLVQNILLASFNTRRPVFSGNR